MKRLTSAVLAGALALTRVRADAAQAKGETIVTKDTTVGEVIANPALEDFAACCSLWIATYRVI